MRRTIYLPVIVLITILFSCTEEPKPVAFDAENIYFEPMKTWKTLAKTHPDSILFLLKSDIFAADSQQNSEEFFQKVVLFYKILLRQHYELNDTILITQAACFYDSLAEQTPPPSSLEMQNLQWMRATAHFLLGKTQQDQYQFLAATENHIAALKILDQWFDDSKKQEVLLLRGDIEFYLGDIIYYIGGYEQAKQKYINSLNNFINSNDSSAIARSYWAIGDIMELLTDNSNKDTSLYFAYKGLEYVKESSNRYEIGLLYGTIGHVFRFRKQTDSAIYYFRKSINLIPEYCDEINMQFISLGRIYLFQNEYDSAIKYILKGFESDNIYRKQTAAIGLSKLYGFLKNEKQSLKYSDINIALQAKINYIERENSNIHSLLNSYEKQKNEKQIIQEQKNYFKIRTYTLIGVIFIISIIVFIKIRRKLQQQKQLLLFDREYQKRMMYQERWDFFQQTPIYQAIMNRSPKGEILTENKLKEINRHLSNVEHFELKTTIDTIFDNFSTQILQDYPFLTTTDLEYIYLSFFDISEYQKAALIPITYKGITSRSKRLCKKINYNNIGVFINQYLYLPKEKLKNNPSSINS